MLKRLSDAQRIAISLVNAPIAFAQRTPSTPEGWDVSSGGAGLRPLLEQPLVPKGAKPARSELLALAARAATGESVGCPWCAQRGVESYANGVAAHATREGVLKVTFDACKHTLNAATA